ncbi:hypothetical protein K8R30_04670 [archaeon]|nr:hypothetical protein [archaeon]
MKIIYTNISPTTNAYTNFNHIFYLKKQKPQKVYLCVWDLFVLESRILNSSSEKSRQEKLKSNVRMIEALMKYLGLNYKLIYLSELWSRAFRNREITNLYHNSLSIIDIEKIRKGFSLRYIPFGDISLSRINYIIMDYLAATFLPELFPEVCGGQPTHYLTSERFKIFKGDMDHILKLKSRYSPPKSIYVTGVPVIIHKKDRVIPSSEMSKDSIQRIVESHYNNTKPNEKEISELFDVLFSILDKVVLENRKVGRSKAETMISDLDYFEFVEVVSQSLYSYFDKLKKIVSKINVADEMKSRFIDGPEEFGKMIKPLNDIKLIILKNCDGANSILDISKKSSLKLSTVSTYITQLRNMGLLTADKKPKRAIEHVVLNLGSIGR